LIPADPRFIACRASLPEARIVLFGIPFEGRINLRRGADHGPRELRLASDSIETYSPFLGRDLEDLAIADLGDCELGDGSPREQLARAREEIRRFWRPELRPVMLGGDHTATLPVIEVLAPAIRSCASSSSTPTRTSARSSWASATTTPRPWPG